MHSYHYPAARIVQFAKAPEPGKVKTRLVPALGEQQACELHERLVRHTLAQLIGSQLAQVELHCDQSVHKGVARWLNDYALAQVYQQVDGDLGAKMQAAFAQLLKQPDVNQMLLVGSDCPFIDSDYLERCFNALQCGSDLVLGPAVDGGYVLIGMRAPNAGVFDAIDWGTSNVLRQTLANTNRLNLQVTLMPELNDIDRPQDLALLDQVELNQ